MSLRYFACALLIAGCNESMGGGDAGMDAGSLRDAGGDAGRDAGRDGGGDAGTLVDAGALTDQCLPYAGNLVGPDGGPGLAATIGVAMAECARLVCSGCALMGGTGTSCGAGGTMTSCVFGCVQRNDFDACGAGDSCAAGQTCDTAAGVCRSDAATTVNDALEAGDVDLGCTTCYANISQCVVDSACLFMCFDSESCACNLCQCNGGCVDAFAACSGLPPYRDCPALEAMCGGP